MNLKVCIAGATGWVGRPLSIAVSGADDLTLVGAVSRTHKGNKLRDVIGDPARDLVISGSVISALDTPTDVLVDYTQPDAVKAHVMMAISKGVHVVIGTSGLREEDFAEIDQAALSNKVGVIAVGNFAITAVLLERFAREAAKHLSHWEIIDYASDTKVDAPSGMTCQLALRLSEIRKPEVVYPVEETVGHKESRGVVLNGSSVHSLRLKLHNSRRGYLWRNGRTPHTSLRCGPRRCAIPTRHAFSNPSGKEPRWSGERSGRHP